MTLRETLSQSVNGRGVTAEIYYDEGPMVYVKIVGNAGYGAQSGWKIRGQNPDTNTYCSGDQYQSEGSFSATNGKTYYFQAVWGEYNGVSNGSPFTVNFGSGSGGGSSGGGSEEFTIVEFIVGNHTSMTVSYEYYDESRSKWVQAGPYTFTENDYISEFGTSTGDNPGPPEIYLNITFNADDGYVLGSCKKIHNNREYQIEVGNFTREYDYSTVAMYVCTIMSSAKPIIPKVHIFDDSSGNKYVEGSLFMHNGSTWEPAPLCLLGDSCWYSS